MHRKWIFSLPAFDFQFETSCFQSKTVYFIGWRNKVDSLVLKIWTQEWVIVGSLGWCLLSLFLPCPTVKTNANSQNTHQDFFLTKP